MLKKLVAALAVTALVVSGGGQVVSATGGHGEEVCAQGTELLAKYKFDYHESKYQAVFGDEVVAVDGDHQNGTFEVLDEKKVVTSVLVKNMKFDHSDKRVDIDNYDPSVTEGSFSSGSQHRKIKWVKFCGQETRNVEVCRDGEVVTIKEHEQLETDLPADDPSCQPKEDEGEVLGDTTEDKQVVAPVGSVDAGTGSTGAGLGAVLGLLGSVVAVSAGIVTRKRVAAFNQ